MCFLRLKFKKNAPSSCKTTTLHSHSSRCSSQWQRCVRAWRGWAWPLPGVGPRGSRALKAGCCRRAARPQLAGRPAEGRHRYWPCAERRPEAYTHPPPGKRHRRRQSHCYFGHLTGGHLSSGYRPGITLSCCKGLIFSFLWRTAKTKCCYVVLNISTGRFHSGNKLHRIIPSEVSVTPPSSKLSRPGCNSCHAARSTDASPSKHFTHTHALLYSLQLQRMISLDVAASGVWRWLPSAAGCRVTRSF